MAHLMVQSPYLLIALVAVGALAVPLLRRHRHLGAVQVLMLVALVLAAARPELFYRGEVPPKRLLLLHEDRDLKEVPEAYRSWECVTFSGSVAEAIQRAAADFPPQGGTLALAGSTAESTRALPAVLQGLKQAGIALIPIVGSRPVERVVLRGCRYPAYAHAGASVRFMVELESPSSRRVSLALVTGRNQTVAARAASLEPGRTVCELPLAVKEPGLWEGRLLVDGKSVSEVALTVLPKLQALLLSAHGRQDLPLLRRLFGHSLSTVPGRPLGSASSYPVIVVGRDRLGQCTRPEQEVLLRHVQSGGGLFVLNGSAPFVLPEGCVPGFAELFPLKSNRSSEQKQPSVAVVFVIDTSASMSGIRLDLAREIARLTIEGLQACDTAGIMEFHGARHWSAPLQSARNRIAFIRALNRLTADGGTVLLPALTEACYALQNVNARLKHVVMITDGGVEYGDFESLVKQMQESRITTSTVMVAPGQSQFLRDIASWGQGRFFKVSSQFAIPDLNLHQQKEEDGTAVWSGRFDVHAQGSPLFAELRKGLMVEGVARNALATGAQCLLLAGKHPLLAMKPTGLGRCAVWNAGLTEELLREPSMVAAFNALMRYLPDPGRTNPVMIWNRSRHCDLDVELELTDESETLEVEVSQGERRLGRWTVEKNAEKAFRFRLPALVPGTYRVTLPELKTEFPLVMSKASDDTPLTEAQQKAQILQYGTGTPGQKTGIRRVSLAPWLALLAAVLFVLQLYARRRWLLSLLLFMGLSCLGGEYEQCFYRALEAEDRQDYACAAEAFEQAASLNQHPDTVSFLKVLRWENLRRAMRLTECLDSASAAAEMPVDLVLNELAERGNHEAFFARTDLEFWVNPQHRGWLYLLAQKSQHPRAASLLKELHGDPRARWIMLQLDVRADLLAGRVTQAQRRYRQAVDECSDVPHLQQLAKLAEQQALYGESELALLKVCSVQGERPQDAFQLAAFYHRHGWNQKAVDLMKKLMAQPKLDQNVYFQAGNFCMRLGQVNLARSFYRKCHSDYVMMVLADLELRQKHDDAAVAILERLIYSTPLDMRAQQAAEVLIEHLQKRGSLADYGEQLAKRLSLNPRQEMLYVAILTADKQSSRLLDYLKQHHKTKELISYYVEHRRYQEAVVLLKEGMSRGNLQTSAKILAILAAELKDKKLLQETLRQVTPDDAARRDVCFEGMLYARMGEVEQAAEIFRDALDRPGHRPELLLLWSKTQRQLGRSAEAQEYLLRRLRGEGNVDMVSMLLDSLMDLKASRETMLGVLADIERRAQRPETEPFYYQLAEELNHYLGQESRGRFWVRMQLCALPESRTILLQRLFHDAVNSGDSGEALYYGRVLLAMPYRYNPSVYSKLCTLFIEQGMFSVAERCMRVADQQGGGIANLLELANIYKTRHDWQKAESLYREMLLLAPDKTALLTEYANMQEYQRDYAQAAETNLKVLKLILEPLAQQKTTEEGRGSAASAILQRFKARGRIFANQAVVSETDYKPLLKQLADKETGLGKNAWKQLLERLEALEGKNPRADREPVVKAHARPQSTVRRLLDDLQRKTLTAGKLREAFDAEAPARRERLWVRLVSGIQTEPIPEITRELKAQLERLTVTRGPSLESRIPCLSALKQQYVERQMALYETVPLGLQIQLACLRHANGQADAARNLASFIYEDVAGKRTLTHGDMAELRRLKAVFAVSGHEALATGSDFRDQLISDLEDELDLGTPTKGRLVALALLYDSAERYDEAQKCFGQAWNLDRDDQVLYTALKESVTASGELDAWIRLLQEKAPSNMSSIVGTLYRMQLSVGLRHLGEYRKAELLLNDLSPSVRNLEHILLSEAQSKWPELEKALLNYLYAGRSQPDYYIYIYPENTLGGCRGYEQEKKGFTVGRVAELLRHSAQARAYVEFLFCGLLPDDPGYFTLWQMLREMPSQTIRKDILGTRMTRLMKDAKEPDHFLLALTEHPEAPMDFIAQILRRCDGGTAERQAVKILNRIIDRAGTIDSMELIETLVGYLAPKARHEVIDRLQTVPCQPSERELELLCCLKKLDARAAIRRLNTIGYSANHVGSLLTGKINAESLRTFILTARDYPDWRKIKGLMPAEAFRQLTNAYAQILEQLYRERHIDVNALVPQLALLSMASDHKAEFVSALKHHVNVASASALWSYDALMAADDKQAAETLKAQLKQRQTWPKEREFSRQK